MTTVPPLKPLTLHDIAAEEIDEAHNTLTPVRLQVGDGPSYCIGGVRTDVDGRVHTATMVAFLCAVAEILAGTMREDGMDQAGRYRKKPIEVGASRWFTHGDHSHVRPFQRPDITSDAECQHCPRTMGDHGWITTLEGGHIVCPGDWIITGVVGEHYPCKPAIFARTYEPVEVMP